MAQRAQAHAEAALLWCTHAEAQVTASLNCLSQLSTSANGLLQAKSEVLRELERLYDFLAEADDERVALEQRIGFLEQTLIRTERDAAREREFLLEQQDTFISGLWDEQQEQLGDLGRRLTTAEDALLGAQQENEMLAAALRQARADNEDLRQALLEAEATRLALSERERRTHDPVSKGSEQPLVRAAVRSDARPRFSEYDLEQPRALSANRTAIGAIATKKVQPSASTAKTPTSSWTVKQKPDPSTRPVVGYSLTGEQLADESPPSESPRSRPPR